MNQVDYKAVEYANILEYSGLVLKEAITGIIIGLGSRLCLYIFNFSGNMLDMEIGFSMVQEMDPTTNVNSTITSNFYMYIFMLLFLVSDMHYFIIDAMMGFLSACTNWRCKIFGRSVSYHGDIYH